MGSPIDPQKMELLFREMELLRARCSEAGIPFLAGFHVPGEFSWRLAVSLPRDNAQEVHEELATVLRDLMVTWSNWNFPTIQLGYFSAQHKEKA